MAMNTNHLSSTEFQLIIQKFQKKIIIKRYSPHTEELYLRYVRDFIEYFRYIDPSELNVPEIEKYLSYLAINRRVSASTQNIALSALVFFFRDVLGKDLLGDINSIRAFKGKRLPVVLSRDEIRKLLSCSEGTGKLILEMLYGTGLRLNEFINLRIKDLDFDQKRIQVIGGKGNKDRFTILPLPIIEKLKIHIEKVEQLHQEDLQKGFGMAYMPDRLGIKYRQICKEIGWQFVFPSKKIFKDHITGNTGRWHLDAATISKIVRSATMRSKITKRVTPHTLRHTFATHLMESGVNLRIIQELLGHNSPETTMIYTHVMQTTLQIKSPLETYNCDQ